MSTLPLSSDLRATSCKALSELLLTLLEEALDLAASAERDAQLGRLVELLDAAQSAGRLWAQIAPDT